MPPQADRVSPSAGQILSRSAHSAAPVCRRRQCIAAGLSTPVYRRINSVVSPPGIVVARLLCPLQYLVLPESSSQDSLFPAPVVARPSRPGVLVPSTLRHLSLLYSAIGKPVIASSMDSDLEAFSHNPTDGSFAPMACQPRA
ncbi:hypothetical protein DI09_206p50 [Mitosporidium daphniae]|uniref:Uncharacterized protein n=1 Tax=Mitosporidium daphniae TaxID=1485682 RepID=A0A098VT19_9MICR|nr:hypothetical protein DI09_206p50 [Mitosporidium daphniae]